MAKTKILPARHSGRLRPHHHTSYAAIMLVLALAIVPVVAVQRLVAADSTGSSGSQGVFAVIAAPLPHPAPTITNLANGRVFTTPDPVVVRGTCPTGALIKIYKDEVMSGAAICQNGAFSIPIDLFIGGNSLIVRAYNINDIPGPDSVPVSVQFLPPGATMPPPGTFDPTQPPAGQLYVTTDVYYRSATPQEVMGWSLKLAGGKGPYSLNINWGDGKSEVLNRASEGDFNVSHAYAKSATGDDGTYTIIIKATDAQGGVTMLHVFALVPSQTRIATTTTSSQPKLRIGNMLQTTWHTLAFIALAVGSVWVVEKRILVTMHHQAIR